MVETTVSLQVYESAVKGRQMFRNALQHTRDENRALREVLIAVRSKGICAGAAFVRSNDDGADRCRDVLDMIDRTLSLHTEQVEQDMSTAAELAEHIAHYPKVRLCQRLDGNNDYGDYLLSEQERALIVKALRKLAGENHNEP